MRRGERPTGMTDANAGRRYTARWHRVHAWAARSLSGDVEDRPTKNERVAIVRGQWVSDLFDDEEAESLSMSLGEMQIPLGPDGATGGRRRVIVRCFSWVIDVDAGGVHHNGQWITTGEGMTARAAAADHNRYCRAYAAAAIAGTESRLLAVTAMEIVIWTAHKAARYV